VRENNGQTQENQSAMKNKRENRTLRWARWRQEAGRRKVVKDKRK